MILVLGGTSDSLAIAQQLAVLKQPFLLSVVSNYGAVLSEETTGEVIQGRLNEHDLQMLCHNRNIAIVIDATHPFAEKASITAMTVCRQLGIHYIRFERPHEQLPTALPAKSLQEACQRALTFSGTIYFTTGSKTIAEVLTYVPKERVVLRVLPVSEVLKQTEALGLQPHQIDALKGPFSTEMNQLLFHRQQAGAVITKESGQAGGVAEKAAACAVLGIPCIVIQRPQLEYPKMAQSITHIIQEVQEMTK